MKGFLNRILAIILSIAMLLGMCPSSFAAAEDSVTYTYNYLKLKWGQWSDEGYAPEYVTSFDMTTAGNAAELDDYNNVVTEPWMFDSYGGGAAGSWTKSSSAYGPYLSGAAGSYAAFRIRVPKDGKYDLIPRFSYFATGATVAFYLAPADAENPRSEEYYLNTIDTYNISLIGNAEETIGTKTLTAGDYILSYVFCESESVAAVAGIYTTAFVLQGYVKAYHLVTEEMAVVRGETAHQKLGLVYGEDEIDFSAATECSAISDNTEIADVTMTRSEDGKELYLSVDGHRAGTTDVTVLVKVGTKIMQNTVTVTVAEGDLPFVLEHDGADSCTVEEGVEKEYTISAFYRTSDLDLNNANLSVSVDASETASVELNKAEDGTASLRIRGLACGAATVKVVARYEGRSATLTIPVTVIDRIDTYRYNFMKLFTGPWSMDGYDPKYVTSFAMTTVGSSAEINPEVASDPWMYDSSDDPNTLSWTSSSGGRGPSWVTPSGGWVRYRIRVPESDAYIPEIVFSKYTNFGQITAYLAPADAFNPADDRYCLGRANGYASSALYDQTQDFRRTYLEAGDYILTMVMDGDSTDELAFFIKEFTLTKPALDTPYLYLPIDRPVGVGVTEKFEICVAKNGVPMDVSTATRVRVGSSKSSIAKVTTSTDEDGKVYMEITGVAAGSTSLSAIVIIGGKTLIHSGWVNVKAEDAIDEAEVSFPSQTMQAGERANISLTAYSFGGAVIPNENLTVTYVSSDPTVADVDENGVLTAYNQGSVTIRAVLKDTYSTVSVLSPVLTVEGYGKPESVEISNDGFLQKGSSLKLTLDARLEHGAPIPLNLATVTYQIVSVSPSGAATLNGDTLTGVSDGTVTVKATVTFNGVTISSAEKVFSIRSGKTRSSYYTAERRAIAQQNYENYDWAKRSMNSTIAVAEKYVGQEEKFWNMITTQELPRHIRVGYRYDPNHHICRYCGVDIVSLMGNNYAFTYNAETTPWKIQCPACARYFPSNDFGKFYESGIDANGNWSYQLALKNGSKYLTNDLYPEKGTGWGVDDGYGYRTGKYFNTGVSQYGSWEETHTYIAYYNHWALWYNGYIINVMNNSALAYVYTGDPKYGRVAAVIVDRIADIYPKMDTGTYDPKYWNNGWYGGKIVGGIWETGVASTIARAYDAVFDLYDDPDVVSFLSDKAETYQFVNKKTDGNQIRQNIDDNFLREAIAAHYDKRIYGNFGFHQSSAAYLAVVLDTLPETSQLLDWMLDGAGAVNSTILGNVSRDGAGNEGSPTYNFGWASSMRSIMDALEGYDKYSKADLYKNPKIIKMFKMNFPLTLMRKTTAQIGDSTGVDINSYSYNASTFVAPFMASGDVELGQMIYFLNGNKTSGLNGGIFTDTSKLQNMLNDVISQHGEYPFDKSMQLTDYGFAILRDGTLQGKKDTQRDFWINYGSTYGHAHPAKLNLGIDAFGLCLAPDMGYPSTTLGTNDIVNWERSTIIHNTVQVNNVNQGQNYNTEKPLHFDDNGFVKVMDVNATGAYSATSIYRRTVVMVNAGEEDSYGIDFFRVKGGNTHVYSFHALSESVAETTGLNLVSQSGTYAGANVSYGPGNVASGHDGLTSVKIDTKPSQKFAVDFAIKDFRGHATRTGNLHLRMTQLNNFTATSVATALGRPPILNTNPKWLQFALVKRTGTNLDSLFTTVFEPYCDNRIISSEEAVQITPIGGATPGSADAAKAVKVTLANGRVDYIVYATNNQVRYRVDNLFDFMGVIGVYSLKDGEVVHAYLCDGTVLGENTTETAAYTGTVVDFTTALAFENYLQVSFNGEVDFDNLVGRFINVTNSSIYNACYEIKGVTKLSATTAKLHLGDVTLIRGRAGVYDVAKNAAFTIPISKTFGEEAEIEPEIPTFKFEEIPTQTAGYGAQYTLQVRAVGSNGAAITYRMVEGPAGASFDPMTRTMSWTPTEFVSSSATFEAKSNGETATVTVPITVTAAPPTLLYGAQIRLNGVQGLRYISSMNRDVLAELERQGVTDIEYGMLLIPSADVEYVDDIKIGATLNGHSVAKVPAVFLYDITDTDYVYTAVITNIQPANYKRAYTARSYLTYTDANGVRQEVYGSSCVSRSIYQIAKAALNDAGRYDDDELGILQEIVTYVEQ